MTAGDERGRLKVNGLTLSFGAIRVLDDVSFEVEPRAVHGLIGPNGAGKSSCFNVISGLYRASSGTVHLDGADLASAAPHHAVELGLGRSFQNTALAKDCTVRENLLLGRHARRTSGAFLDGLGVGRGRSEHRAASTKAAEVADLLSISHHLSTPVGVLPYGLQKRVDMARAVMTDPKVLLLDEPAAGMGPSETADIAHVVRTINTELGISILLVEHDMSFVMGLCSTITVLNFGQVIAEGTPQEIRTNREVIHSYLGSAFDSVDDAVHDLTAKEAVL